MTGAGDARVAVIGLGPMGRKHLAKLVGLVGPERAACYDVDAAAVRAAGEEYPGVAAFSSWEAFLSGDCRAAVITAPAARHAELAAEALAAGKDLLVEKPLALTPVEAAGLVQRAEERGAVLMVGHILLFDPAFEALKAALSAGELGGVKYVTATRAKLGTIRSEEDIFFSLAAHDVALTGWLLADDVTAVSAVGVDARGTGRPDAAFMNLVYKSGVTAHLTSSWLYPVDTRRLVVVGDGAMAEVHQERGAAGAFTLYEMGAREGPAGPETYDHGARAVPLPTVDLLTAELEHFLGCVATRATPRTDGRQGLAVVKVLAAAQKSARGGGAPVRLEH